LQDQSTLAFSCRFDNFDSPALIYYCHCIDGCFPFGDISRHKYRSVFVIECQER